MKKTKILPLGLLKKKLAQARRNGLKVAFTNGCFDLIHYGHISYLEKAKKHNRVLIVGLNSDASIRRIKGHLRPIVPQKYRAAVLAALECVDYVIIFNEDTPYDLIKAVRPDILIKGADWKNKNVVGSDIVRKSGGRVEHIRYIKGLSTTNIISKIAQNCVN